MIILVFASKWSLHCDFFSVFNCFCVCVFQEGISCSLWWSYSNHCDLQADQYYFPSNNVLSYKQISTIFQAIMYSLYKHISFFSGNFLHIFGSISIKITNQISNLHSIRYTTLYLMVLEIREQLGTKVDVPQNLCSDVFSKEPWIQDNCSQKNIL